ncbi:alpha/beta fold hydrolase [Mesorhizobium sp. M5C.F.Ca.IN.020.29.1.1]|uniref:alpha/beta hydrolase n=1 Tax=unclassified Mesorhizobium TaxID=325217 RepID=UPI000FCAE630|nr:MULTISPECIES: alpha/beta fold hydrolase [unclassified Mesorhizobium]RUV54895.1 alpha/beta fold hydrolase [Mesorhizobium sp. M5C.F.Ca.IN.020.29.1.1]TIM83459.1 MAG: alpha/beta hydrolase [Mesorhizobium sp.]
MGRRIVLAMLAFTLILVLAFALGPRVHVDTTVRFDSSLIGDDPQAYLARREAAVPDIRDGLEKEIIWANPMIHARTPLSIVYVHGFSASKGEVRPLPDEVADQLDANLFYTRLTGHGQGGAAMADGSVNAWINDYAEALAIGRAIGDKVIVIATSTGGSLAAWAATQPGASDGVAAIAFISPNFGVRASGAELLTMPWGRGIAQLFAGEERSFPPRNPLHEKFWTYRYPIAATQPMAALTELAYGAPVEKANIPALFIFSDSDRIVRSDRTREIAGRWGAAHELVPVEDAGDRDNHVIAGDALSPATTAFLAQRIVVWIQAVVK